MRVRTKTGEQIIREGQAYYLAPGHTVEFLEDYEAITFSPVEEARKTLEQAARNLE